MPRAATEEENTVSPAFYAAHIRCLANGAHLPRYPKCLALKRKWIARKSPPLLVLPRCLAKVIRLFTHNLPRTNRKRLARKLPPFPARPPCLGKGSFFASLPTIPEAEPETFCPEISLTSCRTAVASLKMHFRLLTHSPPRETETSRPEVAAIFGPSSMPR